MDFAEFDYIRASDEDLEKIIQEMRNAPPYSYARNIAAMTANLRVTIPHINKLVAEEWKIRMYTTEDPKKGGLCFPTLKEILIPRNIPHPELGTCLLHELSHACYDRHLKPRFPHQEYEIMIEWIGRKSLVKDGNLQYALTSFKLSIST